MHLKVLEISYFHANFSTNLQVSGSIFEEVVKSGQKLNVADIEKVRLAQWICRRMDNCI